MNARPDSSARIAWDAGSGSGAPLLLIPGLGGSRAMWTDVRERLDRDHRVVTMDPRGGGESEKPPLPYTGAQVADDARSVLDAAEISSAHVVGLSMGGMIAQELALRYPRRVSSLTLISTYASPDVWARRCFDLRLRMIDLVGIAEQMRFAALIVNSPGTMSRHGDIFARFDTPDSDALPDPVAYRAQLEFCLAHDTHERLGALDVPTLVIWGREDLLTTPAQGRTLAAAIPGAEQLEMEESSHSLIWERSEDLAEVLRDFVSRTVCRAATPS